MRIISFVCLGLIGLALAGPLNRESCVNDFKNQVARDFRNLIDNGRESRNNHKNLVKQMQAGTPVQQPTAVVQQPANLKSELLIESQQHLIVGL